MKHVHKVMKEFDKDITLEDALDMVLRQAEAYHINDKQNHTNPNYHLQFQNSNYSEFHQL